MAQVTYTKDNLKTVFEFEIGVDLVKYTNTINGEMFFDGEFTKEKAFDWIMQAIQNGWVKEG